MARKARPSRPSRRPARRGTPRRRARASPRRGRRWARRLRRLLLGVAAVLLLGPAVLLGIFRYVDPPLTPLMLIRASEGHARQHHWVPASRISAHLAHAAIAAEDNRFCQHAGIDWQAMQVAWQEWQAGGSLRGASTISMQTAKNLFLWPGRDWLRKGLEAWLTLQLDWLWPKDRILEVYLNIVELGPGLYGAEAAAQFHFGRSAATLSVRQAALLATALPAPLHRSAGQPSPAHAAQAGRIVQRIGQLGSYLDCVDGVFAGG